MFSIGWLMILFFYATGHYYSLNDNISVISISICRFKKFTFEIKLTEIIKYSDFYTFCWTFKFILKLTFGF